MKRKLIVISLVIGAAFAAPTPEAAAQADPTSTPGAASGTAVPTAGTPGPTRPAGPSTPAAVITPGATNPAAPTTGTLPPVAQPIPTRPVTTTTSTTPRAGGFPLGLAGTLLGGGLAALGGGIYLLRRGRKP